MNEPSVFNGPEVSMQKDCKSTTGVEHREWHNLYGMYMHRATSEGLVKRNEGANARPMVLSRSFYAGSQRWGPIWTGDNVADWGHLAISMPMMLSLGLAGLTFTGADVGGFFGNPDAELVLRWQQAGAYQPWFRGHAHHDSKRREPWVFGEPWTTRLRDATLARYQLLPFWYTLFHAAEQDGTPTMRPMFMVFPKDEHTFAMQDQYMIGDALLVKPITTQGQTSTDVYFAGDQTWYDVETYQAYAAGGSTVNVQAPVDKIPVFQRGGTIVPRKNRLRRSATLMARDPYTLVVALGAGGAAARGSLYMDDESSFDYQTQGKYRVVDLEWEGGVLTGKVGGGSGEYNPQNTVERVVAVGVKAAPKTVVVSDAKGTREIMFEYDVKTEKVVLRKPDVLMASDWSITLN